MQVDVDETEKESREQVHDILEHIEEDEDGACHANPFTYQAFQKMSHDELLEDIAGTGFSRSYLRRRIELVLRGRLPVLAFAVARYGALG